MENTATRFMLTIPADMAEKAEELKKELFFNKPYAEMYRQLIQIGMEEIQKKLNKQKGRTTDGQPEQDPICPD